MGQTTGITKAILNAVTENEGINYSEVVAACPGHHLTSFHSALINACEAGVLRSQGERGHKTYYLPVEYKKIDAIRHARWVPEVMV